MGTFWGHSFAVRSARKSAADDKLIAEMVLMGWVFKPVAAVSGRWVLISPIGEHMGYSDNGVAGCAEYARYQVMSGGQDMWIGPNAKAYREAQADWSDSV